MTVIAAAYVNGKGAMACDTACSLGDDLLIHEPNKLRRFPFGLVGCSGSGRYLQVASECLSQLPRLETEDEVVGAVAFVEEAWSEAGWSRAADSKLPRFKGAEFDFLILTNGGRIWHVGSDMQVIESAGPLAIGNGASVAVGAMEALSGKTARVLVSRAVEIACRRVAACGGGPVVETV